MSNLAAQITFDTDNLPDIGYVISHHPDVILGVIAIVLAGLATTGLVSFHKSRFYKKHGEALARKAITVLVTVWSAVFTGAGYLVLVSDQVTAFGTALPFVGKYFLATVGVAYTVYNFGLNARVKLIVDKLREWVGKRKADTPPVSPAGAGPTDGSAENVSVLQ